MKILVTGGSGFLGSALARHFAGGGHEVALLLRPQSSLRRLGPEAAKCRIGRIPVGAGVAADTAVAEFVAAVRPDAVLHTACSYGRANESPLAVVDANLRFGVLLLQALGPTVDGRPTTFLNAGSALPPEVSAYALAKRQFADWGRRCASETGSGVRFVDLRLQHFYGPGDDAAKFTARVLRACRDHQPALALTAGEQARDLVHVDDVVAAFAAVLAYADTFQPADAIDVGSGDAPTIRAFVETAHRLAASRTRLDFGALPYRPGEPMHCVADTRRLRSLGWRPRFDLEAGLRDTLERDTD